MRICVVETGRLNEGLFERWGDYPGMFECLWRRPEDQWDVWDCMAAPPPADLHTYDAVILTGSAADAHADEPWILRLKETVAALHARRRKILGICFGHQVVAGALGGASGRHHDGWELGMQTLNLTDAFATMPYGDDAARHVVFNIHRDQVTALPPGARLLGSTRHTPIHMYALDDHILCLQSHPEFSRELVADLVQSLSPTRDFGAARVAEALARLGEHPTNTASRALVERFLRGA